MRLLARLLLVGIILVPFVMLGGACERTITTVEEVVQPNTCFECHSDVNTMLVSAEQQWNNSKHASGDNIDRNSRGCQNCHTSEGFVARAGGGSVGTVVNPTVIHCFTCHAPHTRGDLSLRISSPQALMDGTVFDLGSANLCVACHQARNNVNTYVAQDTVELEERWGPHHGTQGDMVVATNGYEYSWFSYERSVGHRGGTEDGCLDCHFKTTQNNVLGGHSFNMVYEMEDHGVVDEAENTNGCNVSACHDGDVDDFSHADVQEDVEALVDSLRTILFNAGLITDENLPTDGRFVASLAEPGDTVGAVWNFLVVEEDRSHGIHNPKYIMGLLESSIQFMETGPPSPFAVMQRKVRDK